MAKPNYSRYSMEELLDCKENIDKGDWPERYQEILECIELLQRDPNQKRTHDEIVFANFCEELRNDLAISLDDNFWPILKLFSKTARNSKPSTFDREVCPICAGELDVSENWGTWEVVCNACDLGYSIRERANNF